PGSEKGGGKRRHQHLAQCLDVGAAERARGVDQGEIEQGQRSQHRPHHERHGDHHVRDQQARPHLSPTARKPCSMAMPMTRPGSISGETRKVEIASRPGKLPRTSAMEQNVPSTRAMSVDNAAISTEVIRAGARPRVVASRAYHLSDQSGGGKVKTDEEPNDTAIVTASGV